MSVSNLSVFVRVLNLKQNLGKNWDQYSLKCNSYNKKILIKLQEWGYIDSLSFKKNRVFFRPINCQQIKKVYPVSFSFKEIDFIKKQYLHYNKYSDLIVTSSKGILNMEECRKQNIGGIILAKVVRKCL